MWHRKSGVCAQTLEGHNNWVESVAFSLDGRQIASGSCDDIIKVWDRESGACVQTFIKCESDGINAVVAVEAPSTLHLRVLNTNGG